jgi:hypothetical protein
MACTDAKHYGLKIQACRGKNCATPVCENCSSSMLCMMCELSQSDEIGPTDEEAVRKSKITGVKSIASVKYNPDTHNLEGWESLYALLEG